jgi:pimeloyl-ACP methyl ester carboxylesterase
VTIDRSSPAKIAMPFKRASRGPTNVLVLVGVLSLVACTNLSSTTAPATLVAPSQKLQVAEPSGANSNPMTVHLYQAPGWNRDGRIIVVMHGVGRDADRYMKDWISQADRAGALLVVPEFDSVKFPGSRYYNRGNVMDRSGVPQPIDRWTFSAIDRIFEAARAATGATRTRYMLYGHSAGAQFVHRFVLFAPAGVSAKAEQIVCANAGSYTMPLADVSFPWGISGLNMSVSEQRALLTAAFAKPLAVMAGDNDTDPNHPSLPKETEAMSQGVHRYARAQKFYETARAAAAQLDVPFRWTFTVVPGAAHVDAQMSDAAIALLRAQ